MDGLPSCASQCLAQSLFLSPSASTVCSSLSDTRCICSNKQLLGLAQNCGWQRCSTQDSLRALRLLYTTCDYPVTTTDGPFFIIVVIGIVTSTLSVGFRIAGRLMGSRPGLDDGAAFLSLVSMIPMPAICLVCKYKFHEANHALTPVAMGLGLGKDIWFIPFQNITTLKLLFFVGETLYVLSIAFTKICMLLLFLRLFPYETFRLITKAVLGFTIIWCLAFVLALVNTCHPLSHFWHMWKDEEGVGGTCINQVNLIWAHGITNMLLDVAILALPMPTLLKLNLTWGRKVGICLMFTFGLLVTAASITRLVAVHNFNMRDNPTKKGIVLLATWSLVEVPLSITCVCMPGIRAFFYYTYNRFCRRAPSACHSDSDESPSTGLPSTHPPLSAQSQAVTLQSANREYEDFIRLQEIDVRAERLK